MQIDFAAALMPSAKAVYEWKQNARFWQKEENWEMVKKKADQISQIHYIRVSQTLQSIVRELKNSNQCRDIDDLDTSNMYEFKMSFGYGQWNGWIADSFIDLFAFTDYEFNFTQFECKILYERFGVIMYPLPPS